MQGDLGVQVEHHHVQVGQTQVSVQHQHLEALAAQGRGQVGAEKGLAHPALAAGDGHRAGKPGGRLEGFVSSTTPTS